jgi:hypothetical protein
MSTTTGDENRCPDLARDLPGIGGCHPLFSLFSHDRVPWLSDLRGGPSMRGTYDRGPRVSRAADCLFVQRRAHPASQVERHVDRLSRQ